MKSFSGRKSFPRTKAIKSFILLFFILFYVNTEARYERLNSIYEQIDGDSKPEFSLFEKAYLGFIDLKLSGFINPKKDILTIVDFRLSSKEKRMWIIDITNRKVLYNIHVAHGVNSGKEYATYFSNRPNSLKSSLGFYLTGDTYYGKNGLSLKLKGLERGFNNNALRRYIVLHGADYANRDYLDEHGILGNSEGCPAIPMTLHKEIIDLTKDGTCLFLYYPDISYLERSDYMMGVF